MSATTKPKEKDWYTLTDGIRVTVDPDEFCVGDIYSQTNEGLPQPTKAPQKYVPSSNISYIPTDRPGHVQSDVEVERKLASNKPVLLEGEAGTAKNTLLSKIAGRAGLPTYRYNFGLDSSVYDLICEKEIVEGETVTVLGDLAMAVIFGGLFIGDEINMVEGDITSHIHNIAEEKGKRRFKLIGTGKTLVDLPEGVEWDPEEHLGEYIHPAFRFASTANPITYGGTGEMNYAFRSRFSIVILDYPSPEKEAGLLASSTGVDKEIAHRLTRDVAKELRAMYRGVDGDRGMSGTIDCPITHRQLEKTLNYMKNHNTSLEDAVEAEIVPFPQTQMDRDAIRDALDDIFK